MRDPPGAGLDPVQSESPSCITLRVVGGVITPDSFDDEETCESVTRLERSI
jgi:hypothetical protein